MSNPSISEILDAYKGGHIVERGWPDGGTDQCRIDADGQAWQDDDGSGVWRRANFILVHAPGGGTIRIIRPRTEQDVRDNPVVGDVVAGHNYTYTVIYVDSHHVLLEYEAEGRAYGAYWHRNNWANQGALWRSITPAEPEQP
jgi:hypothetical protein